MLAFRCVSPCERCVSMTLCAVIRADCERLVERVTWLATAGAQPLPDAELVLDCRSFSPKNLPPLRTGV